MNLNCVTNRVAPRSRYKLSYDAEQYKTIHTLLDIPYLQPPHPTVRHVMITTTSMPIETLLRGKSVGDFVIEHDIFNPELLSRG